MFDNLKFALSDSNGEFIPIQFTALSLIRYLYDNMLISRNNAYSVFYWISHAEPRQEYKGICFHIVVLDY